MVDKPQKIQKKDLGDLVRAPIDTRNKIISDGRITARMRPVQSGIRLPEQQVKWLRDHVDGNVNYVVMKIMERAISEINQRLNEGGFNIDDL